MLLEATAAAATTEDLGARAAAPPRGSPAPWHVLPPHPGAATGVHPLAALAQALALGLDRELDRQDTCNPRALFRRTRPGPGLADDDETV